MMPTGQKLLECVPNFSEGRDIHKIEQIAAAIRSVEGVTLLHIDISEAANRTVMTFAGAPQPVLDAACQAILTAAAVIDMQSQAGVHPRIGATDVCPLVPLQHISIAEAVGYAAELGKRVGDSGIPVYLYEYAARADYRRSLPTIRQGQYEGLSTKMQTPGWEPDFGPKTMNPSAGATILGVRDVLVAFNISLNTPDVAIATAIAERIRESGYLVKDADGNKKRVKGLLPKVRAIGWFMADYQQAQVSFNLLDYRITSPLKVWNECRRIAAEFGVTLAGSEVIGLLPERCLLEAGAFALGLGSRTDDDKRKLIAAAIAYMGLDQLKSFVPDEKILEYALEKQSSIKLLL